MKLPSRPAILLATLMLGAVRFGWSQETAPATSFLSLLLPVMAVLGSLLFALIWFNRSRGLYNNDGPVKVVQVLPLTARERVVVLETETALMVVGVASGRVSLLSMLDAPKNEAQQNDETSPQRQTS